ncbi:MAG: protein kinase [Burkholderiales bacterium]|nr:protein kinase [Burkholderiales bacterium]
MSLSVLLIDDAADFRALCSEFIRAHWPEASVEQWDPILQKLPAADRDLSHYDVILLDLHLGKDEDGIEWLKNLRARAGCPPIVVITGAGNEAAVLKAMRAGAIDYLPKATLSVGRLAEAIGEALALPLGRWPSPGAQRAQAAKFADSAPIQIEGYRSLRQISTGVTSVIYIAERTSDGLKVAIKFLRFRSTQDKETMRRFAQEREIVSAMESPHVARIYEENAIGDRTYIVMEYCESGDLSKKIADGIEPTQAVELLYQIAEALEDVHDKGIIHRDLKPANIMFRRDGSLVIMDFGIAKLALGDAQITQVPSLLGTPYYMSPEQAAGKSIDLRSDLYSAGVIFYEMLTRSKPFADSSYLVVIDKHLHAPVPTLPTNLARYQTVVERLLAKLPEDRFRDARELRSLLDAQFRGHGQASAPRKT